MTIFDEKEHPNFSPHKHIKVIVNEMNNEIKLVLIF